MSELEPEELESRLELSERKRIQLQKMLTRKSVDEEIPLWSMVDLMTLLLIFFLFFYTTAIHGSLSVSQDSSDDSTCLSIDPDTAYQDKAEAKTLIEVDQTQPPTAPLNNENEKPEQTIEQFREEVLETMDEDDKDLLSISINQHRFVFVLGEQITFNEGEATLLESYQPVFARIADFISLKHEYQVVVSGHTDNKPIRTAKFPSNLELSSARAVTVAKFLIENGVAPHRVSIQGFSEYRPLFENTSPENRQKNRRVEITLIKEQGRG
jgi:chemotaxis protein MotB